MKKIRKKAFAISRDMKKAGMGSGVVIKKGEWQKAQELRLQKEKEEASKKKVKGHQLRLTEKAHEKIMLDKSTGRSSREIASELGVSDGLVSSSLRKRYVDSRQGREILKSVLLENAIAFGTQASEKIEDLNGMQSVVATGIMTQRFIDLDKHAANMPETVDLESINKVGRIIGELEEASGSFGEDIGHIIDITAEVESA